MTSEKMTAFDLVRDTEKQLPDIPIDTQKLRIWYCKYRTLEAVRRLPLINELVIAGMPDADINYLSQLKHLKHLSIVGLAKVKNIDFLNSLVKLESLSLSTPPSWDASSRKIILDSINPIASLPQLLHLELFGVMDERRSLEALRHCPKLLTARFSQYPTQTVDEFYQVTGTNNQANPPGHF